MTYYDILNLKEIDSTNSFAIKNINDFSDKQIITAAKQTSGRGRLARKWISDVEDNVYMSIVLKPAEQLDEKLPLVNITQYMSVILCRVLEEYDVNAEIKWPNDVLVNGKKIAGILSEVSIRGNKLNGYVLGIGINLNMPETKLSLIDQPATSLNILLNKPVNKDEFLAKLLQYFFKDYDNFLRMGFIMIKNDYINKSTYIGKEIIINTHSNKDYGIAKSINDDGSLIMSKNNLEEKTITMGDLICL